MTAPVPAAWTTIAVRAVTSSAWTELPRAVVPLDRIQAAVCAGHVEVRTRTGGGRVEMQVRAG